MEDEDGEVLKKYDLPTQKPQPDIVTTGLKYMGMGVFAKAMDKSTAAEAPPAGEASAAAGEATTQRPRKKSVVVAELEEEDDRHIRFTIGGFGRRMTKEDFIREIQKLDKPARRESEAAPQVPQASGKPDPQLHTTDSPAAPSAVSRRDHAAAAAAEGRPDSRSSSPGKAKLSSKKPVPTTGGGASSSSSSEPAETEVERRRRMAALQGSGDGDDYEGGSEEHGETAAERRRREAALGMAPHGDGEDSDDDDTPRVPPSRKSIRFAEAPDRGRKRE